MTSYTEQLRDGCPIPFYNADSFSTTDGHINGRLCQLLPGSVNTTCCLPCPIINWYYPDTFKAMAAAADWCSVVGSICCVFLLLSWVFLPVEKTHRHYLSICLTVAVLIMNMGFMIPLAANPEQCINEITPNDMSSSSVCATSGSLLMFGGFAGMMWVFLRALSLHLQICWQVVVGRTFMFGAQAAGWLIPIIIVSISLHFSGVSFRFGQTCHVNHENSLADFWIPMLVLSGFTAVLQMATFAYCLKVYLVSLADGSTTTEGSNIPQYQQSVVATISPRQAYRRVKRVVQLQWRGITIVILILVDVIFFSVIFVFQDRTLAAARHHPDTARKWIFCIIEAAGNKDLCTEQAAGLIVAQPTMVAMLILLSINGIWLLLFLGTWNMLSGWADLFAKLTGRKKDVVEFVSKDASPNTKSYELLSREANPVKPSILGTINTTTTTVTGGHRANASVGHASNIATDTKSPVSPFSDANSPVTPLSDKMGGLSPPPPARSPQVDAGRTTPDYFGDTAPYHAPTRSFSRPAAPRSPPPAWSSGTGPRSPKSPRRNGDERNPLGMNQL